MKCIGIKISEKVEKKNEKEITRDKAIHEPALMRS